MSISNKMPFKHHQGMTLVETVLTVGVVAILVSVTVPSIGMFYDSYRLRQEQQVQLEIYDALLRFAEDYNTFPADDNTNVMCSNTQEWYDCLTQELDFSTDQIRYDVWGQERRYVMSSQPKTLLGEIFTVYYASVHSKGPDQVAATATGIPTDGVNFQTATNLGWWRNMTDVVGTFETLQAAGDDSFIKLTDSVQKVAKLRETQNRLAAISQALYDFEQVNYVIDLKDTSVSVSSVADQRMHSPPAIQTSSPDNLTNMYGSSVRGQVSNQFSNTTGGTGDFIENRAANKQARLKDMITLMRMIGLPDEYCCSAIDIEPDAASPADYTQKQPFFYYANPRDLVGGVCNARATQIPFAPVIVLREERQDAGGSLCD